MIFLLITGGLGPQRFYAPSLLGPPRLHCDVTAFIGDCFLSGTGTAVDLLRGLSAFDVVVLTGGSGSVPSLLGAGDARVCATCRGYFSPLSCSIGSVFS